MIGHNFHPVGMQKVDERCCRAGAWHGRQGFLQCSRKPKVQRLYTDGKTYGYCAQHDPERINAKEEAQAEARKQRQSAEDAIEREGNALLERLGIEGYVKYPVCRYVVVSYGQLQKLAARLEGKP